MSQDLGWLTGSSVLPKKRHYIHRVSGRSLFGLRAALYKEEEASKYRWKRRKRQETKNPGVEQRAAKDIEAATVDVNASLERKAALYQQLCQGGENESDEYMVDFERKSLLYEASDNVSSWTVAVNLQDCAKQVESLPVAVTSKDKQMDIKTYQKLDEDEWKRLVKRALWWKKYGFLFGGIPKEQVDRVYVCCCK